MRNYSNEIIEKIELIKEIIVSRSILRNIRDDIKWELEIESDRIWIAQFHNGGNFYPTGKSIQKFSIIYETVNLNVNSIQSNLKNIPVNLFSRSINQLLSNDVIEIGDFKDETIATYGLKYFAEDTGTKSAYQFAIKTIEGKFIGTLGIDFTKRKTKLDMESINHLMVHASSLGGVLMNHLKC